MGHYELISPWFFGKLALKKHFFEVHIPKFADPPPKITLVVKFFYFFFLVASLRSLYNYSRLLAGIPILVLFQNLMWYSNKTTLITLTMFRWIALPPMTPKTYVNHRQTEKQTKIINRVQSEDIIFWTKLMISYHQYQLIWEKSVL